MSKFPKPKDEEMIPDKLYVIGMNGDLGETDPWIDGPFDTVEEALESEKNFFWGYAEEDGETAVFQIVKAVKKFTLTATKFDEVIVS